MSRDSFRFLLALRGIAAGALLAGASSALAVEAIGVLNDTGETSCFDANYNAIACDEATTGDDSPLPRQDARYGRDAGAAMGRLVKIGGGEAGFDFTRICASGEEEGRGDCASPPPVPTDVEHPNPNDWACLRDNVTGLTWSLGNLTPVTWAEASSTEEGSYIQRANASARCGLSSGWRLPARREGISVLNAQRMYPYGVDPAYFPIIGGNNTMDYVATVWSADPTAFHGMFQWTIGFGGFGASGMQCRELAPPYPCDEYPAGTTAWTSSVLLVNGTWRQPLPPNLPETRSIGVGDRWAIRDDGLTVTDNATGLTWDRCGQGQVGPNCEGDIAIFPNWADAMQVARIANEQRYKGYYDWRLPNVRELESIVKIDADPAFDAIVFPNTLAADIYSYYWTSTQFQYLPGWASTAYVVEFSEGTVHDADKVYSLPPGLYPNVAAVRLVRGGSGWDSFDGVSDRLFWSDFDGAPPTTTVH